jgi:hypothetical protein
MKLKENPNTEKKVKFGSAQLPLPIATQLCHKRKVKNNSTKPVL